MLTKISDVFEKARRLVEPSIEDEQNLKKVVDYIVQKTKDESKGGLPVHTVELGGSVAKGTWVRGNVDIDVFIKFDSDISKTRFEDLGIKIGKKVLYPDGYLRYSEHPYVEGFIDGFKVNIVPCYDVSEGLWKSSADRSPFHTEYMMKHLDQNLKNEIRLLKKFLKVGELYGAEIKIQGFSGYVCEVLTLKYGSFISVLEAFSKFVDGNIVSLDKVSDDVIKKFDTSLIILDPIDKNRNLAAAISPSNIASFVLASRSFLKNPDLSFFQNKDKTSDLNKSSLFDQLIVITFQHKKRTIDVLWGQLNRSINHLAKQISKYEFSVLRTSSASDTNSSSAFIFLINSLNIPKSQVKIGPIVDMQNGSSEFLKSNESWSKLKWVNDDRRINVLGERKFEKVEELINAFLTGKLPHSGIAPGLIREIEASFEVFSGKNILKVANEKPWLLETLNRVVVTDGFSFGSN